jgi:hypothetical protein
MEAHLADAVDTQGGEGAEADVEGDAGYFDAVGGELCKSLGREVEAGGGRSYGAALFGEDGLVAIAVGGCVVAMDVGRQGNVADAVEDGEEVDAGRIGDRSEFEEALAEGAALKDFGFEEDFARGRGEDEALADGNLAAGTHEGAPLVGCCGLRFVRSHPCARRKAQGWGTELLWRYRLGEHDFDAAGGLFTLAAEGAAGVEARGNYAAVVEDQQVASPQMSSKTREKVVMKRAGRAVHDHHAAGAALGGRLLRDELFWEFIVEVCHAQARILIE